MLEHERHEKALELIEPGDVETPAVEDFKDV